MSKPLVAITGASSGIGAAAAQAFSAAGHPLLLTARRLDRLEALGLPDAMCRQHDVVDADGYRDHIAEAEAAYGPIDLLINNAGFMTLEDVVRQTPDAWQRQFDVNCVGLMNTTHAVLPGMLERGRGTIMNLGSTAGHSIYPNHTVYCSTKHAVHALTEGVRREAAGSGVRVILMSPGLVSTELLDNTASQEIKDGYRVHAEQIGGSLTGADIAAAMVYAYEQPQNICIWEMIVAPTGQMA
jgi:NADP-dependent 3-hydroxy acid dehydrogenase YdfG